MRAAVLAVAFAATTVAGAADAPKPATPEELTKTLNAVVKLSKPELDAAGKVLDAAIDAGKQAKSPAEVKKIAGQAWHDLTGPWTPDQKKELNGFIDEWGKARIAKTQKYQYETITAAQREQAQDQQRQAALRRAKNPADRNRIQQQIEQDKKDDQKDKERAKKKLEEFQKRVPKDDLFDVLLQMKLSAPRTPPKPATPKPDAPDEAGPKAK
jgi:hypothetical protein